MSRGQMRTNFDAICADFASIPVTGEQKVRVGVVGEIYVKFSPLGNNNLEDFLLSEGAEPVVPGLTDFMIFKIYNRVVDVDLYGGKWIKKAACQLFMKYIEACQKDMIAGAGALRPLPCPGHLPGPAPNDPGLSGGRQQDGRGLAAHRRDAGAHPHRHPQHRLHPALRLSAQPHRGQGHDPQAEGRLSRTANIVAIDYDPGATKINQENRIKLMLANAKALAKQQGGEAPAAAREAAPTPSSYTHAGAHA